MIIGIGLTARAHAVTLRGRIAAGAPCSLYSESAGREGRIARMYGPEDRILNGDYKFPDPTMVK